MPAYKDEERNSWYVQFYYVDWQGKRHKAKKRGFAKKSEAQEYERNFLSKASKSCDMPFRSFVELYLNDKENRLKGSTMFTKENIISSKIVPYFGDLPLNKIDPTTIRTWQNMLISSGKYAKTYLKTIHNQMSAIMNYAVTYYDLPRNPCRVAGSMGRKKAEEMLIWTLDEFKQFIACVDRPVLKLAFEIMFWCGLRSGETVALKPKDILPSREVDVCKTLYKESGIEHFYDPKTTKSYRKVSMPEFLYRDIQDYLNSLYLYDPEERIFYFDKSNLNKCLDRYAYIAGVKRIRVHDIRHSHASMCIEMEMPILLISERLGHESVQTTWNTYAHLYPNRGAKLAEELEKIHERGTIEPK